MAKKTEYGQVLYGLIGAWFVAVLTASKYGLYVGSPGKPPLAVLVSVLTPLAVFAAWYRGSKQFREYLLGLDPRMLTRLHAWRAVGLAFVALATFGILPRLFALSAGWGDIAIGATAFWAASRLADPAHRRGFVLWQLAGVADLVTAVGLGAASQLMEPAGRGAEAMAVLPMSVIPTFGVPLLLILHGISLAQARRWAAAARRESGFSGVASTA